jgi:membrane dipeptidase
MGGIVGLNYCCEFVRDGAYRPSEVSFDDMSAHLERFLDLGGEDAIALGSDFDGCTTPAWLASARDLGTFRGRVAARFGETIATKIFFENARTFFERNETA